MCYPRRGCEVRWNKEEEKSRGEKLEKTAIDTDPPGGHPQATSRWAPFISSHILVRSASAACDAQVSNIIVYMHTRMNVVTIYRDLVGG